MIGSEFADRLSGRPPTPLLDPDDDCPICVGPGGRCVGAVAAHQDTASTIREYVVARGQQQTRRAPGRPLSDPEAEAARQEAWVAKQEAAEVAGEPLEPVGEPEPTASSTAVDPAAVPPVSPVPAPAEPVAAQVAVSSDPSVQTLSPLAPGRTVDPDAGSPRLTDHPTLVRTGDGAFRSQAVDHRAAAVAVPASDPTEVRDVYAVPEGVIDPVDDPHRPDPATTVLVSDAAQLVATGAWTTLPGGTQIATTRRVLRVWYPMGTLQPSYSTVADRGVVLPKPPVGVA